jgi:hypothetical protein
MAHIKISNLNTITGDLSTGTDSLLTELQATESSQIIGGGYAYIGGRSNGYGNGGTIVAGYGSYGHGKGGYISGDGEGNYTHGSYYY